MFHRSRSPSPSLLRTSTNTTDYLHVRFRPSFVPPLQGTDSFFFWLGFDFCFVHQIYSNSRVRAQFRHHRWRDWPERSPWTPTTRQNEVRWWRVVHMRRPNRRVSITRNEGGLGSGLLCSTNRCMESVSSLFTEKVQFGTWSVGLGRPEVASYQTQGDVCSHAPPLPQPRSCFVPSSSVVFWFFLFIRPPF